MERLRILMLEDSTIDAEIIRRLLIKEFNDAEVRLCMTKEEYLETLFDYKPDVILADNSLPQFDAIEALNIVNHHMMQIPFILVTGTVSEEFAVNVIKRGADDYILKDRLGRLPSAIDAALKQRKAEKDKTKASHQLEESEEKYRTLVEQAFDGIIIYSPDGKILEANQSACISTGYTQKELCNMSVAALFFEEDLVARPLYFESLKAGNSTLDYRRLKKKNGNYVEMEIGTKMTPDGNMMAVGRDITERKKAEENLARSEKRFRTLVENNEGIILLFDEEWNVLYRSPSAVRITGWSLEEYNEIKNNSYIHPDDFGYVEKIKKEVIENPGKTIPVSMRVFHKTGRLIWLEGVMTNMLHDPDVKGIIRNVRDVTERKMAEDAAKLEREKLEKVAAASPGLIYSLHLDNNNNFTLPYASGIVEDIVGFKHEEIAEHVEKVFDRNDSENQEVLIKHILESAKTMQILTGVWKYNHPKKGPVWLESHAMPAKEPDGSITWYGITSDITERKNAEQKIIQSEINLKAIFDNTSEGFVLTDTEGSIKAFNCRTRHSILLNTNEVIANGRSIFDFIENTRKDFFRKIFLKIVKGESIQYDRSFIQPNGTVIWINFSFNPVKKDDVITGVCITGSDITEKKMAEQQREFDHNNLNALINNTRDLIWSIDTDHRLITSNLAFDKVVRQMSGNTLLKGTDILSWGFSEFELKRYQEFYRRGLSGEAFTEIIHTPGKNDLWSEISFYPIYKNKAVIGLACFSRNITDRKKAEEDLKRNFYEKEVLAQRLSTILNTLPANIALLDENATIVDVNQAWKNFADNLGLPANNYFVGANYLSLSDNLSPDKRSDGKKASKGVEAVLKNKMKQFVFEYNSHLSGEKKWYRMVASPISEKENKGAVVMHIDISEIRKLEEERIKNQIEEQKKITRAMVQGQEKERNAIGRELHDNMNQILAGVNLLLGMLKSKPERLATYLPLCIENINLAITENRKIAHELVSPNQRSETLTDQIDRLCKNMLQNAGMDAGVFNDDFNENLLNADQKLTVYRIVQEQCTNIVKYSKAKNVDIVLATLDNKFSLKIEDDGQGMAEDEKIEGIGLQNMISRLSILNGNLFTDTAPGKGFSLYAEIPL